MAVLTPELTAEIVHIAWIVIGGGTVWLFKTKQKAAKEETREQTKEVVLEMLKPALVESNADLLKTMNGTYLRTAEALLHFANIDNQFNNVNTTLVEIKGNINALQSHHHSSKVRV